MTDAESSIHEAAHVDFWTTLDPEHRAQAERICRVYGGGDFDESYLGFLGTYHLLARLIPRNRVVYDVGCAHAFQAWFFRDHAGYVGISDSPPVDARFATPNTRHVHMPIQRWAVAFKPEPLHFAIHNYCPGGRASVVAAFTDLFTFYPQGHATVLW